MSKIRTIWQEIQCNYDLVLKGSNENTGQHANQQGDCSIKVRICGGKD